MQDFRTAIEQKGITYYMTFEQINAARRGKFRDMPHLDDWFNTLPFKEKLKVRPDWQPPADEPFYPDPEWD